MLQQVHTYKRIVFKKKKYTLKKIKVVFNIKKLQKSGIYSLLKKKQIVPWRNDSEL